jgi:ferrous iron transport protein B
MATRTLRSPTDRLLTMLIIPFMSCSARLPVYVLFISAFFPNNPALVLIGIYFTGIFIAFLVAQVFNRTVFKSKETPFVLELPPYRVPTIRNVMIHMWDKTWQYLKKIGGVILVGVIIIWALGYFPREATETQLVEAQIESALQKPSAENAKQLHQLELEKEAVRLQNSYLGEIGKFIEPVMRPLGFDWKMSVSLLAGLPAKEIVVSTMGVLYQVDDTDESVSLTKKLQQEKYQVGPKTGQLVISTPVALAFLIFILIYFPCIGVIATIKNESGKLFWAVFTMVYTTTLAWIMAFLTLHVARFLF